MHDHDHDHEHRHDARIKTFSLVHDGPVPFSAIEMFLDLLRSAHGDKLLRMKGVIELARGPGASAGDPRRADASCIRRPGCRPGRTATRGTRLVLITLDMPEDYVRRMFARLHQHAGHRHARPRGDRATIRSAIAGMR